MMGHKIENFNIFDQFNWQIKYCVFESNQRPEFILNWNRSLIPLALDVSLLSLKIHHCSNCFCRSKPNKLISFETDPKTRLASVLFLFLLPHRFPILRGIEWFGFGFGFGVEFKLFKLFKRMIFCTKLNHSNNLLTGRRTMNALEIQIQT